MKVRISSCMNRLMGIVYRWRYRRQMTRWRILALELDYRRRIRDIDEVFAIAARHVRSRRACVSMTAAHLVTTTLPGPGSEPSWTYTGPLSPATTAAIDQIRAEISEWCGAGMPRSRIYARLVGRGYGEHIDDLAQALAATARTPYTIH